MRLLLTGASGQLGSYLLRELSQHRHTVVGWSGFRAGELLGYPLRPVDLADQDTLVAAYRVAQPELVIHAAALSTVGACFGNAGRAELVNVEATQLLAELASESRTRLVFVSTDLVFDGTQPPYREQAATSPLSIYGRTKAAAERRVLAVGRSAVARVSLLFGTALNGKPSFFDQQVAAVQQAAKCTLFADEWRTPLSLTAAAAGLLAVAESDYEGLLHMGGPQRMSRLEMGQGLAQWLGLDAAGLQAGRRADIAADEPRPRDVSLDSSRWRDNFPHTPWPSYEEALSDFDFAG